MKLTPTPQWIIVKDGLAMLTPGGQVHFADPKQFKPNTYDSKYAAKQHLKKLDNIPDNIKFELVSGVE